MWISKHGRGGLWLAEESLGLVGCRLYAQNEQKWRVRKICLYYPPLRGFWQVFWELLALSKTPVRACCPASDLPGVRVVDILAGAL